MPVNWFENHIMPVNSEKRVEGYDIQSGPKV